MHPISTAIFPSVSRETQLQIDSYINLLTIWQQHINLIGKSTIEDIQTRHINESLALLPLLHLQTSTSPTPQAIDIGTGAGIPGFILQLARPDIQWHIVDSDKRKCAFLREACHTLQPLTQPRIHACRLEDIDYFPATYITSRACAPLYRLFELSEKFLSPDTICFFYKGEKWYKEIEEAQRNWAFSYKHIPMATDDSVILTITQLARAA